MRRFMERTKTRMQCAFLRGKMEMKELLEGEKGASDMVTVIILIVVVIAVAAIFRERLLALVTGLFDKLDTSVNGANL